MRLQTRVPWTCLALYLGSALLILATSWRTQANRSLQTLESDEVEYYLLAGQVLEGHYEFNPRRVIGHVMILAGSRSISGDRFALAQALVSLIFALTAPLTYLLARREWKHERAALLAGLGVMAWPLYIYYGGTLYSETLALPCFLAFLLGVPGPESRGVRHFGRWLGAGALLGLCMHVRPMYLLYSPFGAAIAYWRLPERRGGVVRVAGLTAGVLLVVLPWSLFLSIREGTFVLLSSSGGETLAGGLNPELIRLGRTGGGTGATQAGRSYWYGPGKWLRPQDTGYLSPEDQKLPYTERGRLLTRRAIAWIQGHPRQAAYLSLRKLTYMWGIYPFWNGTKQTLMGNIPTLGLLFLATASLIRFRRHLRELAIFWTLPLFVSVVALISWGSWRFRQPGDLGLIVLVAALPWASEIAAGFRERTA